MSISNPDPTLARTVAGVVSELGSYLSFTLNPASARLSHLRTVRLDRDVGEITLVGTMHGRHLRSDCYSIGHLCHLLETVDPQAVALEIRPDYVDRGWLADAPIDMAFLAYCARTRGLPVIGVDHWCDDNTERENRMFASVREASRDVASRLVSFVGFSHVYEMRTRFEDLGLRVDRVDRQVAVDLFGFPSQRTPQFEGLVEGLLGAADRADRGVTQFGRAWAENRRNLADMLASSANP